MTDVTLAETDEASFDADVLTAETPVLVDFWAPWCGPCYPMAKVLEQVAEQREGALAVVKVNADESPVVAARYRVMAMPTLMLFHRGEPVWSVVGARSKARIDTELDDALSNLSPAPSR